MRLMATCCPGLEFVLAKEITARLGAEASAERGKLFFEGEAQASLALRCADNLHAFVGGVKAGPHRADLPALAKALASLPLREVLLAAAPLGIAPDILHVSASRVGRQSYSRFEAAAAALPVLSAAAGGKMGDAEHHTCALRLDVEHDAARLYVKLTPPAFRFRGVRDFSSAALRPTIAHALVRLTEPADSDVFLDPFCGSGTLLTERAAYPARHILGGDIDEAALAIAKANAPGCDVRRWNALSLPLADASVDAAASNPPWGKQIEVVDVPALYGGLVAELGRVGRPDARIVLLTDKEEALAAACASLGMKIAKLATISLHGTLAGVFRIAEN